MRWLESQWAISCYHAQTPQYGNAYAVWKCIISFTSRGITRSRCLTLCKFKDPLLEPLAVLNPLHLQVWKLLRRSQFLLCCPRLVWVFVRTLKRAGKHETIFFLSSSGTMSRMHKSLVLLRLSHYFLWAVNLPFHLWWTNFAKVCMIFILPYVFGKRIRLRIWNKRNRLGNSFNA